MLHDVKERKKNEVPHATFLIILMKSFSLIIFGHYCKILSKSFILKTAGSRSKCRLCKLKANAET